MKTMKTMKTMKCRCASLAKMRKYDTIVAIEVPFDECLTHVLLSNDVYFETITFDADTCSFVVQGKLHDELDKPELEESFEIKFRSIGHIICKYCGRDLGVHALKPKTNIAESFVQCYQDPELSLQKLSDNVKQYKERIKVHNKRVDLIRDNGLRPDQITDLIIGMIKKTV